MLHPQAPGHTCLKTRCWLSESADPSRASLSPTGLAAPSGPCRAGYFCAEGAASPAPEDGLTGAPCPPGTFCRECLLGPHSQPALPSARGTDPGEVGRKPDGKEVLQVSHEAERGRRGRWLMCTGCSCGVSCSLWTAGSRWGGLVMSPGDAPPRGSLHVLQKGQGAGPRGGWPEAVAHLLPNLWPPCAPSRSVTQARPVSPRHLLQPPSADRAFRVPGLPTRLLLQGGRSPSPQRAVPGR